MQSIFWASCSIIVHERRNEFERFSYFAGAFFVLLVVLRIYLLLTIIKITVLSDMLWFYGSLINK